MKKELLCPVGNQESLLAAIHNGADAIYLGGKSFGARAYASNFSDEEIIEIIKYAHLYDVKVYVTINTLIKNHEIEEVLKFIELLHKNHVDAIIIQDIGLAHLVNKTYPNLELHASTQMHNLDTYSSNFLEKLGIKRMVVARELSLDDINQIDTNLEIEAFIHGALCVSYSGQCLISSLALKRSGNKGECAQLCRMPYSLNKDDKKEYLLSPKDVNSTSYFNKVMQSNIYSLKIEGRMKSASYVALVTRIYRKLIDAYYNNQEADIKEDLKNLDYLFNRSYSKGYLGEDNNIINKKRPNHIGVVIGKTIKVDKEKITIKLSEALHVGDGIKFDKQDKGMNVFNIYVNNKIVKDAYPNDIITIPNNISLKEDDIVLKTTDLLLEKKVLEYPKKKIKITVSIKAIINEPLTITFQDNYHTVTKTGKIVEKSMNNPTTKNDIINQISKLGNTPYFINNIKSNIDNNIFIPISEINNLRRELTDELSKLRTIKNDKFIKNQVHNNLSYTKKSTGLNVFVRTKEQLDIVKSYDINKIYTNNYSLYQDNKDLNIYYEVNINETKKLNNENLLVNSTSDIEKYKNNNLSLNYTLNIYNKHTINYLEKYDMTLSPEIPINELIQINKEEILIYGKVRVMSSKLCINEYNCSNCNNQIIDKFNNTYKTECINNIRYIYDCKNIDYLNQKNKLNNCAHRIDFLDEKINQVKKVMDKYYEL